MTQFEALERAPEPGSLYIEDLGTIVHTTALDLEHVFSHHGVRLSVRLDPDAAMSNVPKSYARIVLEQLLRNAAKFNYPGGNATVRARIEDRELVMEIEDDGWGIPPQDRAAIFDSFYQNGEVLARTANGIGLGLALVRIAVQKMQGSIEVSSLPGEGSTFTVRLPTLLLAGNSA
jgi:signal transduction histidine kinase